MATAPPTLSRTRLRIATRVRELRRTRRWTQADLAGRIGLSQSRLSEIEGGDGSFTAEQLLAMLQLFNVDVRDFVPAVDDDAELQNALARHGALHVRENTDTAPSGRFARAVDAVRGVLLDPRSARLVTALAPALVWSINEVPLPSLQNDLVHAGVPRRLGWLVENIVAALSSLEPPKDEQWRRRYRRAETVLTAFLGQLDAVAELRPSDDEMPDPFDRGILSPKTWRHVLQRATPISRRWKIATELVPDDFAGAIEEARASG